MCLLSPAEQGALSDYRGSCIRKKTVIWNYAEFQPLLQIFRG